MDALLQRSSSIFGLFRHLSAAKQQLCFPEKPQPQSEEKNRVSWHEDCFGWALVSRPAN